MAFFRRNKTAPTAPEPQARYYGLNDLDRKLERFIDFDRGYFVELGANDGVNQSNTLYFEQNRGWRGVLIEPFPPNFFKCRAARSKDDAIYCCACVGFDYKNEFVKIAYSNLMSTPLELESDIADPIAHANVGRQFLDSSEDVIIYGAQARTLQSILDASGAPPAVDLLSLDVEGAEIEVLRGVDHSRQRFRYICVECRDFAKMDAYLKATGYRFVEKLTEHDYLFEDATPKVG
jgi:FkbM family methyltransferase